MLALHDGTYINAWTNIDTPLLLLASISVTNTEHPSSVHSYYTLCHNNQSVIIELNA